MMVLPPIVSYLMAETFSISGMLALMCCSFLQSIYASKNLERERATLLENAFKALSYSFRSICEILIGICFALHLPIFKQIGPLVLVLTLLFIFIVSYSTSYLVVKRMQLRSLVKTDTEALTLVIQSNTRGLLGLTLALQNFNMHISAIALLYIISSSLIAEPVMNFLLNRHLEGTQERQGEVVLFDPKNTPTEDAPHSHGCFKSCILNLHKFTLTNWLVKDSRSGQSEQQQSEQFEKLDDSYDSMATIDHRRPQ